MDSFVFFLARLFPTVLEVHEAILFLVVIFILRGCYYILWSLI